MNAIELASKLLIHFGSLSSLFCADKKSFSSIKGFGTAKYCQLKASLELTERYLQEQLSSNNVFTNPK